MEKELIARMIEGMEEVPAEAEVFAVRQYSLDETEKRARRFLSAASEAFRLPLQRGEWNMQSDRTLIRLPHGARAVVYHASGSMRIVAGLNPMESLFEKADDRERLTRLVEEAAERLKVSSWIGQNESLRFERLWQIKAAAADKKGTAVQPVLCRVVGAYRHSVGKFPVWGAASVAVKLAGGGSLDSLTVQMREPTGEVLDRVAVIPPERAAEQILSQVSGLMARSKSPLSEVIAPQRLRFGYLSLSKRKVQRILAPVYIASIETRGTEEQAYFFAVPAGEKAYLPLCTVGSDPHPTPVRSAVCPDPTRRRE